MKYVDTGSGKIPLISLIAMLSISLTVNLPGLAISPIMDKLDQVFTHVSELEVQLLTVLPNLVTIPFILFSGKLCNRGNQVKVLSIGLAIYALAGVLYFFAKSMVALIVLSCLLGVGCGLVIPLAASLISQNFVGSERTKQLGMKSSISNFTVIFATLFVGWVAAISWHMAFIVYLVPVIPLCLAPFMTSRYLDTHRIGVPDEPKVDTPKTDTDPGEDKEIKGRNPFRILIGVMIVYFLMTYSIEVVSYYLPFSMARHGLDTDDVGIATAMFFLAATLGGFFLTRWINLFKRNCMLVAVAITSAALFFTGLTYTCATYIAGAFLMGLGYGIVQPILYDKTSILSPDRDKSTQYFALLLTCNYIGISTMPFIMSGAESLFGMKNDPDFPYIFNGCVMAVLFAVALFMRRTYVFDVHSEDKDTPMSADDSIDSDITDPSRHS